MSNTSKHSDPAPCRSRRNPILFSSAVQDVTVEVWQLAHATNPLIRDADVLASWVTDMVPTVAGDDGLKKLEDLLSSTTLANFRDALSQLPVEFRPVPTPNSTKALQIALMLAHRRNANSTKVRQHHEPC